MRERLSEAVSEGESGKVDNFDWMRAVGFLDELVASLSGEQI